jgi:hypothetical protein
VFGEDDLLKIFRTVGHFDMHQTVGRPELWVVSRYAEQVEDPFPIALTSAAAKLSLQLIDAGFDAVPPC